MNQKDLIESINKYWKDNKIFQKSVEQRSDKRQSITYDGPPFASGTPHFGHGLTSAIKDAIGRYKTMKGYKVVRNRGRDCHGLPVEKYVEKLLGLDGKKDIEKLGEEKFIEACRESVKKTDDERKRFVDMLGRWSDMDNAYFTMDLDFMESVIWVFKNLYNMNLVYKGFKIQGYCPSCATGLSNSEINDGYKDKQDPAITVKFPIQASYAQDIFNKNYEHTQDGFTKASKAIIKNAEGKILLVQKIDGKFRFPGGKVESGETNESALKRELKEELGIVNLEVKFFGKTKLLESKLRETSYYEVYTEDKINNLEKDVHIKLVWGETIDSENKLGYSIKIDGTIIDDENDIINNFWELYNYKSNISKDIFELNNDIENLTVNLLAWTTTPWTLPSNVFLAVGVDIIYNVVFDKNTKEYYVLAENLLKSYYKKNNEYILVIKVSGKDLNGLNYEPLFKYVSQSNISDKYKSKFFHVIIADFVSTDSGTGIVHQAPAFGQDDFDAVCTILPKDKAKDWLFMPVDEYGEFNQEVKDYQGQRVYDANKEIINKIKEKGKFIHQSTIEHSYPHCRRCDTPLIYKALSAWFVKEQEISSSSLKNTEKINFIPDTVKKRFQDTISSAPDRNISRNRYRGSPLPIRECQEDENDRIVLGSLDELYQYTKEGSKNITKNILIRHALMTYNVDKKLDSYHGCELLEEGLKQSEELKQNLLNMDLDKDNLFIVLSPLKRTLETIVPYLSTIYSDEDLIEIKLKYKQITDNYKKLRDDRKLIDYIKDNSKNKLFEINKNLYVDYRITDIIIPEYQDKSFHCTWLISKPTDQPYAIGGESVDDVFNRVSDYIENINAKFKTKTIITMSHQDTLVLMSKKFKNFDFLTQRNRYKFDNIAIRINYRDNDRNKELDLHKPYVDNYTLGINGKKYIRIPEVLDCWFESGAMPYGQVNYRGDDDRKEKQKTLKISEKNFPYGSFLLSPQMTYPADYIIEGLDQTRGWFRTLHILGNGIMKDNAFNNVIINGLILAEDGKKMSKKLKNYPDPKYLFEKYGSDAYRLYVLSSPSVRAEPVRFTEKGVDQIYKDFIVSINNVLNFFSTYAKVDKFTINTDEVYFVRHAKATSTNHDADLTEDGLLEMEQDFFIENILRINPDIILSSPTVRTKKTAEKIQNIIKNYLNKDINIVYLDDIASHQIGEKYFDIIQDYKNKKILIVGHNYTLGNIRRKVYLQTIDESKARSMGNNLECIKLPTYNITNELDKWILAELNKLGIFIEQSMDKYSIDVSTKAVLGFMDKLTNRYIRRSRRRFWATGINDDKTSAYNTLFWVLDSFLKISAPYAPFITEYIWLEIQKFRNMDEDISIERINLSIHLTSLPIFSKHYIDDNLLEEISFVRRIISLGLFIRSKNNIKVKQPLKSIEVII